MERGPTCVLFCSREPDEGVTATRLMALHVAVGLRGRTRDDLMMTLRDELRQFMVACEVILDRTVNADEFNHLEIQAA